MFTNPEAKAGSLSWQAIGRRPTMPQIIVTADQGADREQGTVMLRERISVSDFECATFATRLIERLGWAVSDAHAAEQEQPDIDPPLVGDR
jgi:hypothetical protein